MTMIKKINDHADQESRIFRPANEAGGPCTGSSRIGKLMAGALDPVEPQRREALDPHATKAAAHIAQARLLLGEIEGEEARAMCATLRTLVPQVENIRPRRTT